MEEKELLEEQQNLDDESLESEAPESKESKEESEDLFDTSIAINKPNPEDKPYAEVVEEERTNIIAQNKKGNILSTVSILVVLALSITGIFLLNVVPIVSYVLMGLALTTLVVFTIVTHRIAKPDINGYIIKASTAINTYVFQDNRFQEVKYDPKDKVELADVFSDGVFEGLVRIASRNVVEGKFNNSNFKVCECALFYPNQGKKPIPAFVGKYLTTPNNLHFEGRIVIVSKGSQDIDLPSGIEDLKQVENNEKFFVYAPKKETLKELDKDFINKIKAIQVANHLLNLTVVIWGGRSIVYASYDDATITLPFYDAYQPDTADQYRADLVKTLEALELLKKE